MFNNSVKINALMGPMSQVGFKHLLAVKRTTMVDEPKSSITFCSRTSMSCQLACARMLTVCQRVMFPALVQVSALMRSHSKCPPTRQWQLNNYPVFPPIKSCQLSQNWDSLGVVAVMLIQAATLVFKLPSIANCFKDGRLIKSTAVLKTTICRNRFHRWFDHTSNAFQFDILIVLKEIPYRDRGSGIL